MAVDAYFYTIGLSGLYTDKYIIGIRYDTYGNNFFPSAEYPCVIPAADFNYSFWKGIGLSFLGAYAGSWSYITNIRIYCDGTISWDLGTGGMLMIGVRDTDDNGCALADIDYPTGTTGVTGDYMGDVTDGHTYYKGQTPVVADITDYSTPATALLLDSTVYTEDGSQKWTKHCVTQAKIASDATHGAKPSETLTFIWDEI